jgi:HK97 gp10 family phage protein
MAITWHGNEFWEKNRKDLGDRLERAAIYLENEIKKSVSDKSPPVSDPGNPPNVDTGELRRSITHEVDRDNLVARVGTNKIYGRYLEMGTDKMQPRPFLAPALESCKGAITEILKG